VEIEGEGEPLILLHGFTGSTKSWQRVVPFLRNRHQLIRIDLIGHGLSEAPADHSRYSMHYAIQDLLFVLDYLGLGKIHLLGYSMGGRCALHFAAHYPRRVKTLILESSSPGIENYSEREARIKSDEALAEFIETAGLEAFVNKWTNLDLFASQQLLPEWVRNEVRLQRLQNRPQGLANSLRGMGTGVQQSLWNCLKQIEIPTLLLVGKMDAKFCRLGVSMHELMPNSTLQIISDAGHTIHLERPVQFTHAVNHFLASYSD
jgi:2-succinyl-6-hydroxy-2,4-cyclohexadiene-1-carboxylate synthase